jgi:hypothetical protein
MIIKDLREQVYSFIPHFVRSVFVVFVIGRQTGAYAKWDIFSRHNFTFVSEKMSQILTDGFANLCPRNSFTRSRISTKQTAFQTSKGTAILIQCGEATKIKQDVRWREKCLTVNANVQES